MPKAAPYRGIREGGERELAKVVHLLLQSGALLGLQAQLKYTWQGMMWLPLPSGCAEKNKLGQGGPVWMAERGKKPGRHKQGRRTLRNALARTTQGIARDPGASVVMSSATLLVFSEDSHTEAFIANAMVAGCKAPR